jgi:nucleoside-diphosphate-sugar epimerase
MAEAFWNAGWTIRLFDRATDDLGQMASGADVIVNGWNPAYPDWAAQLPELTARVIDVAQASGATVILAGNVYVFGSAAPEALGPDTPHAADNPLGRLRIDMEAAYRAAGIPVITLRCGDFLDTEASGNWFDRIMAPSLAKGVLTYPGNAEIDHAWAFLPDVARAAVMLADRRHALPRYADIAFPGYTLSGRQMAALAAHVLGRPVRVKAMNWLPLQIARPFWKLAAPLLEMRYLWNKPHHLSRHGIDAVLPDFRPTDPADALAQSIAAVLRKDADPSPIRNSARAA